MQKIYTTEVVVSVSKHITESQIMLTKHKAGRHKKKKIHSDSDSIHQVCPNFC